MEKNKIPTNHPEWYKVGYIYTSQYEPGIDYIIRDIEVYHTGLSFPMYLLRVKKRVSVLGKFKEFMSFIRLYRYKNAHE